MESLSRSSAREEEEDAVEEEAEEEGFPPAVDALEGGSPAEGPPPPEPPKGCMARASSAPNCSSKLCLSLRYNYSQKRVLFTTKRVSLA